MNFVIRGRERSYIFQVFVLTLVYLWCMNFIVKYWICSVKKLYLWQNQLHYYLRPQYQEIPLRWRHRQNRSDIYMLPSRLDSIFLILVSIKHLYYGISFTLFLIKPTPSTFLLTLLTTSGCLLRQEHSVESKILFGNISFWIPVSTIQPLFYFFKLLHLIFPVDFSRFGIF